MMETTDAETETEQTTIDTFEGETVGEAQIDEGDEIDVRYHSDQAKRLITDTFVVESYMTDINDDVKFLEISRDGTAYEVYPGDAVEYGAGIFGRNARGKVYDLGRLDQITITQEVETMTDGGHEHDQRECNRCGDLADETDFETDPRWGEVCDGCHAELIEEHGEFGREPEDHRDAGRRERGDGSERIMTDGGSDAAAVISELYSGSPGTEITFKAGGETYSGQVVGSGAEHVGPNLVRRDVAVRVDETLNPTLTVLDDGHGPFEATVWIGDDVSKVEWVRRVETDGGVCRVGGCTDPVEFPSGEGERCIAHCAANWVRNGGDF